MVGEASGRAPPWQLLEMASSRLAPKQLRKLAKLPGFTAIFMISSDNLHPTQLSHHPGVQNNQSAGLNNRGVASSLSAF